MTAVLRAASTAPLFVLALALGSPASAQAPGAGVVVSGAPSLPTARARPPARRVAARPAPARPRVPVRPAVNPGPFPSRRDTLASNGEHWAQITPEAANARPTRFPIGRRHEGPSVLNVQVLLDRALFSPGMLDGKWGRNTEVAIFWLQAREGLPATGIVDSATYERLFALAGRPSEVIRTHELTADDVRGPFTPIPGNIYEHARLSCSCYESLGEKLTESFHARSELLRRLNPGVNLNELAAGARLRVPNTRAMDAPPAGQIAELWVSGEQNFLQAVDAQGRILYHFPTTLGSSYDPSPQGDFSVRSIHPDPWWRYQPKILAHVPDDRPEASIPPGPNNSVGRVWMALSAPHYGIHGTKSPETIGYAQSAGCVRLTNWDVMFLSRRVPTGTPVRFRDTRRGERQPAPATAPAAAPAPRAPAAPSVLGVRADSAAAPRRDSTPAPETAAPAAPAPAPDTTRPTAPATPP